MKSLSEIYSDYQSPEGHGDKGTAHSYINEYEKLLNEYRENSTVLEIGICQGESLKMWDEYFINSKVYGVDITDQYIKDLIAENKYNIIIEDVNNLDSTIDRYKELHNNVEIIDNRHIKNRVDDVLVIYKF